MLAASFAAQSGGYFSGVCRKLADVDLRLIVEALTGLTRNPINHPLHFLRDMFVLFARWPVLVWLIRRTPLLGLALVALIFIGNIDGQLVRRDTMAVTSYVGLLFGSKTWAIEKLDVHQRLAFCGIALKAAALA